MKNVNVFKVLQIYSLYKYTPFYKVVIHGFKAANIGLLCVSNERDEEEFRKDGEMFSKTAKAIDDLLGTTMEEREKWLECCENCL